MSNEIRLCQYGTIPTDEKQGEALVYAVDPRPLGKKSSFLPGGDAKLKSILVRSHASGHLYWWRGPDSTLQSQDPAQLLLAMGWEKYLNHQPKVKAPKVKAPKVKAPKAKAVKAPKVQCDLSASARREMRPEDPPLDPVITLLPASPQSASPQSASHSVPITYDQAIREGLDVISFAAGKHYKTNQEVYARAAISQEDLEQHLAATVLVNKYLKEVEGNFQWFIAQNKEPWTVDGFRSSLYQSCWRACLAHHRKHVGAQKRSAGLKSGSIVFIDAVEEGEEEDADRTELCGDLSAVDDGTMAVSLVNALYRKIPKDANGNPTNGYFIPHMLAVYILQNVARAALITGEFSGDMYKDQHEWIKRTGNPHSTLHTHFEQAWLIMATHVRNYVAAQVRPQQYYNGGLLNVAVVPDNMSRRLTCPTCTVDGVRGGLKVARPRTLSTDECHRDGNTLFCPCGTPLEMTTWRRATSCDFDFSASA